MQISRITNAAFAGILCIVMVGCATPNSRKSTRPQQVPQPVQPQAQSTPLEMGSPVTVRPLQQESTNPSMRQEAPVRQEVPVVVALLEDVDRLQQSGDLDQAAARVERGLRIAPKDSRLWQRLAVIRLQQERPGQAENMAKKSNSLARGDYQMQSINWQIIAESRVQRGDAVGAERARDRAAKYQ